MRMKLLISLAGAAVAVGVVACSSAGGDSRFDTTDGTGGASGNVDGGNGLDNPGRGGDADASTVAATPVGAGSVVLVHASRNLPAFRACFAGFTQTLPLPDDKIMPNANVVGVDVGTAVHIGKLDALGSSQADASVAVYDAGEAGASAPLSGDLSIIEEKLARQFFPQGTDPKTWPNCQALTQVLKQNGYEGHGLYTLTDTPLKTPNDMYATFVIVKGCVPDPVLTTKECGAGFTAAKGNLSFDTLEVTAEDGTDFDFKGVTASPAVADGTVLSFYPTNTSTASTTPLPIKASAVSSAVTSTLPTTDTGYTTATFELRDPTNMNALLLQQTLAAIQARSAPRDLPAEFFGLRSTFVLFAIGDPAVVDKTAPTALHLLAIPVQDPGKIDPDSGAL